MADEEQVKRLRQGAAEWNKWLAAERPQFVNLSFANLRGANLEHASLVRANLTGANLRGANLHNATLLDANLARADLTGANLKGTYLGGADLYDANLIAANLTEADLTNVSLWATNLRGAHLTRAHLSGANLRGASLNGATLTGAQLWETVFADVDLTGVIGLEQCVHLRPSIVDHRTLQKSGPLPLAFLRGVGLPDNFIEHLPSLLNQPVQHYSCFISYSSKDDEFAQRIHADLQNSGVRCWFAPHDLPIGGKILDEIDVAIRLREKVVLILSEHSIKSDWVEDEVIKAFEEERKRGHVVLFPIRLDDAVMTTDEAWAAKLRAQRHIGDLRCWKDHDGYMQSFERVLRDLKASPA
jgi:uncharacterized protein YjbI with pentapeptide repeats